MQQPNPHGHSSLMNDIIFEDGASVEDILARGANVNHRDHNGTIALIFAIQWGNNKIIQLLLDHGTNVNIPDRHWKTALHCAAIHGNAELVRTLLKYGANIHARDCFGMTALHYATAYRHVNAVRMLLDHWADTNIRDRCERAFWDLATPEMKDYARALIDARKAAIQSVEPLNNKSVGGLIDLILEY